MSTQAFPMPVMAAPVAGNLPPNIPARPAGVASLNPDTYGAGGLFDQANAEIVAAEYTAVPPPGYVAQQPNVFLKITFKDLSDPTGQLLHTEYYSAGSAANLTPDQSGEWMMSAVPGKDAIINNNTNLSIFNNSLVEHGYPKQVLECGSSRFCYVGLQIQTGRVARKDSGNLPGQAPKANGKGPVGTLACAKLIKLPWEQAPRIALATRPGVSAPHQMVPPPVQTAAFTPPTAAPMAAVAPVAAAPMAAAPMPMAPPPVQQMAPPAAPQAPAQVQQLDDQSKANLTFQTIATILPQSGARIPVAQLALKVFNALNGQYDTTVIGQIAQAAANTQWLESSGHFKVEGADLVRV